MGNKADNALSSFGLLDKARKQYETVLTRFKGYLVKRKNVILKVRDRRKQEEGKLVDDFIIDLYCRSEHCSFGALQNETIDN